jgi:uncharacterized protein YceK
MHIKYQNKLKKFVVIVACSWLFIIASGCSTMVKTSQANHQKDIVEYEGWMDPDMAKKAAGAGLHLTRHLYTAMHLLKTGNIDQSKHELAAGADVVKNVESITPYAAEVIQLSGDVKNLANADVSVFFTARLPKYASLDTLANMHFKSDGKLERKKPVKIFKLWGIPEAAKQALKTEYLAFADTVYLPLSYVDTAIHEAEAELGKEVPNISAAEQALDNALASLTMVANESVYQTVPI